MTDPGPAARIRRAAHAYTARGWRIFPVAPGGKTPLVERWPEVATTDTDQIVAWWDQTWPTANIGIATGPASDLLVVDIDNGPGKHGDDAIADLQATYGDLPATIEVLTGGGGRHLYYRWPRDTDGHPVDIRNNAGTILGHGIDIRGNGGYVVAPPSVHASGRTYEFEASSPDQPADAPNWLVDILTTVPARPERRPTEPHDGPLRPGDRFAAEHPWHQLLEADGATYLGTRKDHRHGSTYELWSRPPLPGEENFEPHLSATLGYAGSDVLKVFTSNWGGVDEVTGRPWRLEQDATYTRFGYYTARHHGGDHQAAARALGPRYRDAEIAELLTSPETNPEPRNLEPGDPNPSHGEAPALDSDEAPTDTPNDYDPFGFINWPEAWARETPTADWLIEPFIARGRGHSLYAGAKTGKSLLTLEVAAAAATGRPVLDQPAGEPIPVLYLDYEMTVDDVIDRLKQYGYGPDDLEGRLHYALIRSLPPLDTADGGIKLARQALDLGAKLVIIDTTARAIEGDENDADTLRAFYRHTGQLLKRLGITYIRLDHAGKDETKGQRGTSAKNDDVDVVWKLERRATDTGADGFRLIATHRRMAWVPDNIHLVRDEDTLTGVMAHRVVRPGSGGMATWTAEALTVARRLDELGVPDNASRDTARAALRDAGIRASNTTLGEAVAYRKRRHADPSDLVPNTPEPVDNSEKTVRGRPRTNTPPQHPGRDDGRPRTKHETPSQTPGRSPGRPRTEVTSPYADESASIEADGPQDHPPDADDEPTSYLLN